MNYWTKVFIYFLIFLFLCVLIPGFLVIFSAIIGYTIESTVLLQNSYPIFLLLLLFGSITYLIVHYTTKHENIEIKSNTIALIYFFILILGYGLFVSRQMSALHNEYLMLEFFNGYRILGLLINLIVLPYMLYSGINMVRKYNSSKLVLFFYLLISMVISPVIPCTTVWISDDFSKKRKTNIVTEPHLTND